MRYAAYSEHIPQQNAVEFLGDRTRPRPLRSVQRLLQKSDGAGGTQAASSLHFA